MSKKGLTHENGVEVLKNVQLPLSDSDLATLENSAKVCRGDILTMTTVAKSGHQGGSMSSIDALLAIYAYANISPENMDDPNRDRIVVSIGHISPAVYSTLSAHGFINREEMLTGFRHIESSIEGHVTRSIPGVEWTTGNLGQGLSTACGFALSAKIHGSNAHTYCLLGDGESQKGQLLEAARFASKYKLSNITALIDYNALQSTGKVGEVMPTNIKALYTACGWHVEEIDGHNFKQILPTINSATKIDRPVLVILNTTMGKGVSFMENKHGYHGAPTNDELYAEACAELGVAGDLDKYRSQRWGYNYTKYTLENPAINMQVGFPKVYPAGTKTDNRSAFGNAIHSVISSQETAIDVKQNTDEQPQRLIAFDCDLLGSVKLGDVAKNYPNCFYQAGIMEHHVVSTVGAMSVSGIVPFFAGFGMFNLIESYNQNRMNDINGSNVKLAATHCGVDVGEDGKTHHCVDYLALVRNLPNFKLYAPADANQTDRIVRQAAREYGNVFIAMGRSPIPTITNEDGTVFFDENYRVEYGKVDTLRKGDFPLLAYGQMTYRAIEAYNILKGDDATSGLSVGVHNVATPLHIDENEITRLAKSGVIFTYEDHLYQGGLFATVSTAVARLGLNCRVVPFGISYYAPCGASEDIYKTLGLDPETVAEKIQFNLK